MRHGPIGLLLLFSLTLSIAKDALAQDTLWATYQNAAIKALGEDKLEEAERLIRAAMTEAAAFGANDPYRRQAKTSGLFAWILHRRGRDDDARPLAEWALKANKAYEQPPGPSTYFNLDTLGEIYRAQRD